MPIKNKSRYRSDAFEAVHSAGAGMYKAGTVDKQTMRSFDESCLAVPGSMEPAQTKSIRESQQVSQPVFARYLYTSESTVGIVWSAVRLQAKSLPRVIWVCANVSGLFVELLLLAIMESARRWSTKWVELLRVLIPTQAWATPVETVHSHIALSRKLEGKTLFIVLGGVEKCGIAERFPSPFFGRLFHASLQAATSSGAL